MVNNKGFVYVMHIVLVFIANQISNGLNEKVVDLCPISTDVKIPTCSKPNPCDGNRRLILKAKFVYSTDTCIQSPCGYTYLACCYNGLRKVINPPICDQIFCPTNMLGTEQLIEKPHSAIRISYECDVKDENEEDDREDINENNPGDTDKMGAGKETETNGFPAAGYVGIGLVLVLVLVVVAVLAVLWRRKKRTNNRRREMNIAYETTNSLKEQNSTYETLRNSSDGVYSEINDKRIATENTDGSGETTDYNKLNLKYLPVHHDPTYGFNSVSTNSYDSNSKPNENALAKTEDTYNHLNHGTSHIEAPPGGIKDNPYNTLQVTVAGVDADDSDKKNTKTYSHIGSEAHDKEFKPATESKGEIGATVEEKDHEYFVLENQRATTTDREMVSQNHDYFVLENQNTATTDNVKAQQNHDYFTLEKI